MQFLQFCSYNPIYAGIRAMCARNFCSNDKVSLIPNLDMHIVEMISLKLMIALMEEKTLPPFGFLLIHFQESMKFK